jgi:hypothetical protein
MPNSAVSLYERDFYAWANEQAALLRADHQLDEQIHPIRGGHLTLI